MTSIVSYNALMHKAYGDVPEIVASTNADILCLQEVRPDKLDKEIAGLKLAKTVQLGSIGLATYYNPKVFEHHRSTGHELPKAAYELMLKDNFRLIITTLTHKKTKQKLLVGNTHLANLFATNYDRRRQVHEILTAMNLVAEDQDDMAIILAGDFNYPIFPKGLLTLAESHGFADSANGKKHRTHQSRVVRHPFDKVFLSNITAAKYTVLPFGTSDHAPVLVTLDG